MRAARWVAGALVVVLVAVGTTAVDAGPAGAVNPTILVTTTADVVDAGDGVVSFREALAQADAQAGPDTIQLAHGATYVEATCGSGNDDGPAYGDLDITSAAGLTIHGDDATLTTIALCSDSGLAVLHNQGGGSVSVDHLTLIGTGGGVPAEAVFESNGPTVVDHLTMSHQPGGAGVDVSAGTLTATAVTVSTIGIGLSSAGALAVTGATITSITTGLRSDTSVTGTDVHLSGARRGVDVTGPATITDSTISGMTASGAVRAWDVEISHSVIDGNTASTNAYSAGVQTNSGTISDSVLSNNTCKQQGICAGGLYSSGPVTILRTQVVDNSGFSTGGIDAADLTLTDSSVLRNRSIESAYVEYAGAGGVMAGRATVTGSTIATNWSLLGVGGLRLRGNSSVDRSTIADNVGSPGGSAVRLGRNVGDPTYTMHIRDTTIVGNDVAPSFLEGDGVAVAGMVGVSATIDRTVVAGNRSVVHQCQAAAPPTGTNDFISDGSCGLPSLATPANGGDPMLSALGDHGGPTPTMVPEAGSPLVDRIGPGPGCGGSDQRGVSRPRGPACDVGAVEADSLVYPDGSAFTPMAPVRVVDTRDGTGGLAPLGSTSQSLHLRGTHGVPDDATAVVLNVTGTGVYQPTFVTIYPSGNPMVPNSSTLNLAALQTAANQATVKLGADGGVSFVNANGTIALVVDLAGYFAPAPDGTSTYEALAPSRLADSRLHQGLERFGGHAVQSLVVAGGTSPVPSSASAVVVNLTGVNGPVPTFLTAYPKGGSTPTASNLNLDANEIRANLAVVKVGDDGSISVFNDSGQIHVVVDVVGYFVDGSDGSAFVPLPPKRIIDTRPAWGIGALHRFATGETQTTTVVGGAVPADARAVVLNVTVVAGSVGTFVTAFPTTVPATAAPTASNVNVAADLINPNLVVVKVGADGQVSFRNDLGGAHLVVDLVGYFR